MFFMHRLWNIHFIQFHKLKKNHKKSKKNDIVNYLQEKSPDVEVTDLSDNALSVIGTKSQIYQQIYRAK